MIDKNNLYAIVGASSNEEKYGFKVAQDLLSGGYRVALINPKGGEILSQPVFKSLSLLPRKPDVVIFIVPPAVALETLAEVKALGINKTWFQPGSESAAALEFCAQHGIEAVSGACIMIQRHNN